MSRCRLLANRRDAERFTIKNPSFTVWKKRHRQYGILVFAAWFLPPCGTKCQGCNLGASFFVVQNKLAHPHNSVKYAVAAARRKQLRLSHWHANHALATNPTGVQDVRELFQIAVSPVTLVTLVSPVSLVSLQELPIFSRVTARVTGISVAIWLCNAEYLQELPEIPELPVF